MPDIGTEGQLLAQLRDRDANALAALYDQKGLGAYSLFFYVTGDCNEAQSLVQELFLEIWNRAPCFANQNQSLNDCFQSAMRRHMLSRAQLAGVDVANRLLSVAPAETWALELCRFYGFSQQEIATLFCQPLPTVRQWIQSAISRVRKSLPATSPAFSDIVG